MPNKTINSFCWALFEGKILHWIKYYSDMCCNSYLFIEINDGYAYLVVVFRLKFAYVKSVRSEWSGKAAWNLCQWIYKRQKDYIILFARPCKFNYANVIQKLALIQYKHFELKQSKFSFERIRRI